MDTLQIGNWISTDKEHTLSQRELEAAMHIANDLTVKEIAREMHIEAGTVKARLDNARFKLGMQRSLHGLCAEIIRRGIIAPLSIALCIALIGAPPTESRTATPARARPTSVRTVRAGRNNYGPAYI